MTHQVARIFDYDFIYFDLLFCVIWILILIRKKKYKEFLFGLFGAIIVFLVDDIIWLHIQGTRHIAGPVQSDLFLLYFSFTYGMIEFSYVTIMFGAKKNISRFYWTLFLYIGWIASALMSQKLPIDDRNIDIYRKMAGIRPVQITLVVIGYILLIVMKYSWKSMRHLSWRRLGYLFIVGILVHFGMEFSLVITGIRPSGNLINVLLFNSLLEFNMGIPFLYIMWIQFKENLAS